MCRCLCFLCASMSTSTCNPSMSPYVSGVYKYACFCPPRSRHLLFIVHGRNALGCVSSFLITLLLVCICSSPMCQFSSLRLCAFSYVEFSFPVSVPLVFFLSLSLFYISRSLSSHSRSVFLISLYCCTMPLSFTSLALFPLSLYYFLNFPLLLHIVLVHTG